MKGAQRVVAALTGVVKIRLRILHDVAHLLQENPILPFDLSVPFYR
jgi:hypothetical protein